MAEYETVQVPIAINGLNKDLQPTQIPSASPNMKNMYVESWGLRKRLGYMKKGLNLPLTGIGSELIQYIDGRGNVHHIALTTTCAFLYDSSYDQWIEIMPSTQIQDCEAHAEWTGGTSITTSDSTEKFEGTNSLKLLAGAGIAAGALIASTTTFDDSADLSSYGALSHISFWYYASKANVAITIHVKDADSDVEALSYITSPLANTWYHCCVEVDLSGIATATSIEIDTETALVATDYILIDDIRVSSAFSSAASNRWSHTTAHDSSLFTNNGGTALVISNNVDNPLYFEGQSADRFQDLDLSDITSFSHAKEIIEFWNHFFLINYNNGNANVRGLVYADLGNISDYTSGTSGANILTDSIGRLIRARKLSSDLVIYSENSITACRYLGGIVLFAFYTVIYETGLFCEKGLMDFANIHYFIGTNQKIYSYTSNGQISSIGDAIEDSIFAEMDVSNKDAILFGVDLSKKKLHILFPTSSTTYSKCSYSYNYRDMNKSWEYHEFADDIRAFSIFDSKTDWYCDGPEVGDSYCDELSMYCDDSSSETNFPTPTFISSDGNIFIVNDITGKDNYSNIECIYDTMDYTVDFEEHYFRTAWLSFNAMSTFARSDIDLYYSTDSGDNWTLIESGYSISEGEADVWSQHRVPIDVVSRRIRFRFLQNSSKDFRIRSMHVNICVESDR